MLTMQSYLNKMDQKLITIRRHKEAQIDLLPPAPPDADTIEKRLKHMDNLQRGGNVHMIKASNFRDREKILLTKIAKFRLYRRAATLILVILFSLVVQSLFPQFGNQITRSYYETVAQLFPVLLIACYLNDAAPKSTENYKLKVFIETKFTGFFITLIGMVVSLAVIATDKSTTASLILTIAALGFMLRVLMEETLTHE